jgi:hypothetical protein
VYLNRLKETAPLYFDIHQSIEIRSTAPPEGWLQIPVERPYEQTI